MDDEPRLLHRRSELGYTVSGARALPGAGEAVSERIQADLVLQAQRRAVDRRRAELELAQQRLRREADYHAAQARAREREIARLQRRA